MRSSLLYRTLGRSLVLTLLVAAAWPLVAPTSVSANESSDTLAIDEVRIGMRGYGLSVFSGTEVEAFPVEVISIMRNSEPQHDVIWIRCPSARMQRSGPVQGMSGSPIYLWPDTADGEGETDHEVGEGGKLIGAFAFGFANQKDALVGVQPIEYMRSVGERAGRGADESTTASRVDAGGSARATLNRVRQVHRRFGGSTGGGLYLDAFERLLSPESGKQATSGRDGTGRVEAPVPAKLSETTRRVEPLLLPMAVGSAELASAMRPLLEPAGLTPVAGEGMISGRPPASVRAGRASLEPGGVLAIPLVFGDVSMAASGTVTDVTTDGTVLGFGHAMFGRGPIALPMATGFVHFVVPSRGISFKTASALNLEGSLVQDEATAVAGVRETRYRTAPVKIAVDMPGMRERTYDYEVVHHPQLTSQLTAVVTQRSINAVHSIAPESTMRLRGRMEFTGDRPIEIETTIAGASAGDVIAQVVPPVSLMMQNSHQRLAMERARFEISVEREMQRATLTDARVDEVEVRPGQTVNATLRLQPYGEPVERRRIAFELPEDIPVGDYRLAITDAQGYQERYLKQRPHLSTTSSVDDLYKTLKKILSIKPNAIYVTLQLNEKGVAIGREELPQLPSSQQAMLTSPTSTTAIPFVESVDKVLKSPYVTQGELQFRIHVRKPNTAKSQDG